MVLGLELTQIEQDILDAAGSIRSWVMDRSIERNLAAGLLFVQPANRRITAKLFQRSAVGNDYQPVRH